MKENMSPVRPVNELRVSAGLTKLEKLIWENRGLGIGDLCNLCGSNERVVSAAFNRASNKVDNAQYQARNLGAMFVL